MTGTRTPRGGPAPASTVLEPGYTWRTRMPRGVLDPLGPRAEPITTPTDRRLLWPAWSDRAEPHQITGMAVLSSISLAMVANSRLFQEAGHPPSAAG
jgi:hypothetical protein